MTASMTRLPVLGVPVESKALSGMDSLLSIVQMPAGIPVGTLAIGKAGAANAGLMAAAILATADDALAERLEAWRRRQTDGSADRPERHLQPAPPSGSSAAARPGQRPRWPRRHQATNALQLTTPHPPPPPETRQSYAGRPSNVRPDPA